MNAHKFVAGNGIEKAKRVLNESPSNAQSYQDGYYFRTTPEFLFHNGHHHWNMTTNNGQYFKDRGFDPISISELKQVVESFGIVKNQGGYDELKQKINEGDVDWKNIPKFRKAIEDYEHVQAYKNGDA
ncbi:hypothetical protein [Acinetobacter soli]|uniref:hypothetical protein n=1 Tax=Acinetobacter soli TaxID=487316 RepID=UPI00125D015B|nr:hypothetical protein [Acinetobacter soli]